MGAWDFIQKGIKKGTDLINSANEGNANTEPESATKYKNWQDHVNGGFSYSGQGALDGLVSAYQNASFSYDPEADAAFQNYAKMMREQGSLAMKDTMGKAAAMTGGYGNSYAETAGQSMYNQYLGTIDAKAEDYYDRALAQFQNAQNQRLNSISILQGERADEREAWEAEGDRLYRLYTDAYNTEENEYQRAEDDEEDRIRDAEFKAKYGDPSGLFELGVSKEDYDEKRDTESLEEYKNSGLLERKWYLDTDSTGLQMAIAGLNQDKFIEDTVTGEEYTYYEFLQKISNAVKEGEFTQEEATTFLRGLLGG